MEQNEDNRTKITNNKYSHQAYEHWDKIYEHSDNTHSRGSVGVQTEQR